jgi:parallel beta-helix repeat protein
MRISVLGVAFAGLLIAVPAAAVDLVVDDNGVTCLSGRPLHTTISAAVAAAAPGEKILVCAGTYSENVTVNKANLTIQGQGNARLRPGDPALNGINVAANGVTIRGLDVSGFSDISSFSVCGVRVGADGADISDNRLSANFIGICVSGGSDHRVRYNVVQNNDLGIDIRNTSGSVDVSNNTVKNNAGAGIFAHQCAAPGVTIDHNAVTGSGTGIFVGGIAVEDGCDGAVITNNTVRGGVGPHPIGIGVSFSAGVVVTRNLVQDATTGLGLVDALGATASFNSISFNGVGIDIFTSDGVTVTRNNVSRSTIVDCRWDGDGVNVLTNNNCGTQDPAGAFD